MLPSKWSGEGVPGALVESKMAGIAAIVSDWNFNAEIVKNDSEGIVLKEKLSNVLNKINSQKMMELKVGAFESRKRYDMSVELIDYKCEAIANREKTYPLKECLSIKGIYNYLTKHKSFSKRYDNMWDFMKKNMLISRAYDKSTISQSNKDYDTFVVGSDIVWGMPVTGHDFTYMLDFVEDAKKKVAFSPSIGTPWNEDEKEHIKKLLNRFDFISTREELGAEWVEELTHKPVEVSCDPTMLWDRNFWGELADDKIVPERPYVLVYMTTTDKKNIKDAISYGKEHNMPVYYLNFNRPVKGLYNISPMTVGEWIALFKNADTVFSASYHGLVFSLYFQKKLFYYNRGNKARMKSFGEELRIQHREGTDENLKNDLPIDYEGWVNKKLEEKRNYSWNLLKERLL